MIRRSIFVAVLAISLSLLAHLFGLSLTTPSLTESATGAARPDSVELSSSFEDLADAAPEPVEPEPAETPEPPVVPPEEPSPAEIPTSQALVASPDPQQGPSPDTGSSTIVQPEAPEEVVVDPEDAPDGDDGESPETATTTPVTPETGAETPVGDPEVTEPVEATSVEEPVAEEPEQLAALPAPASPVVPLESPPVEPETPDILVAPEDTEPSQEDNGSEQAVVSSPRPRLPDRRPQQPSPGALDASKAFENLRFPEQTVDSPLTVYRREGLDAFRQDRSGNRSGGRGPGNSDTTNYAGEVLVHLNRAPIVYVATRGFAQVFFEINPDGTLAWVDVVDSSGAQDVERAAKEQVRTAAPFPPPPGGVSRKLSFFYQIR